MFVINVVWEVVINEGLINDLNFRLKIVLKEDINLVRYIKFLSFGVFICSR